MAATGTKHKHDPGVYVVYVFSKEGRPKGHSLRPNYQTSLELASRWKRIRKGTSTIHRCLYNNAFTNPTVPES